MRRNRFDEIQKYIHFANNTQTKMWKLCPLMDKQRKKCLEMFLSVKNLVYNETMIQVLACQIYANKLYVANQYVLVTKWV